MIKLEAIRAIIEYGLTEMGGVRFILFDSWGDYKKPPSISKLSRDFSCYGLITSASSAMLPLKDLDNIFMDYKVRLTCNVSIFNDVMAIVSQYCSDNVGNTGSIDDYAYIVSFNMPTQGGRGITLLGDCMELEFGISYQFIKGGKLSNAIKLSIDGAEVTLLSSSLSRIKIGEPEHAYDISGEMCTAMECQGLTISARLPYIENDVIKSLVKDIATCDINKLYTLAYKDDNVDKSWSVVLKSGEVVSELQKMQTINVEFVVARSASDIAVKIDDHAIKVANASISRDKIGEPEDLFDSTNEMRTAFIAQGLTVSLEIPYDDNKAVKSLASDIAKDNINKVYKLSYNDSNINQDLRVRISNSKIIYRYKKIKTLLVDFVVAKEDYNVTTISVNDIDIDTYSVSMVRQRMGEVVLLLNSNEIETIANQQDLAVNVVMPYTAKSTMVVQFAKDIMTGSLDGVYKLKYSDGRATVSWNRMMIKSGEITYERQKMQSLTLTFVIAAKDVAEGRI